VRLYSFFNSSTSYRVRIALELKHLSFETCPINIRTGEHRGQDYLGSINASAGVPVLEVAGVRISQSLSIIEYLDAVHPLPRLIPEEPVARAAVASVAQMIACDIHPLNNLRVLRYLQETLGVVSVAKDNWYLHWITEGLTAVEHTLAPVEGPYCFGAMPSLADCCLIPQVANVLRMKLSLEAYPRIAAIYQFATAQPEFQQAAPERQPDYVA
jgi:maleylacetoacetate isomerase